MRPSRNNDTIAALIPPEKGQAFYWDDSLKGFGVRLTPGGTISYIVQGRVDGNAIRKTIGRYGVLTAIQARKLAKTTFAPFIWVTRQAS